MRTLKDSLLLVLSLLIITTCVLWFINLPYFCNVYEPNLAANCVEQCEEIESYSAQGFWSKNNIYCGYLKRALKCELYFSNEFYLNLNLYALLLTYLE